MRLTIWGGELTAWTSAAAFAESGNDVTLIPHPQQTDNIEFTENVYNEPGLLPLIQQQLDSGKLDIRSGEQPPETYVHILALAPDQLPLASKITSQLNQQIPSKLLLINLSNFGVGSSDKLEKQLSNPKSQSVAYLPDMLAEGSALSDFRTPTTLVVGTNSEQTIQQLIPLYKPLIPEQQWKIMSCKEAELTKFAITGMLALRLGFINELANLAEQLTVDIEVIRDGMSSDRRIGPHYLNPGCGFGGLNFQQYIEGLSELLTETRSSILLDTVLEENEKQKESPFRKLWQHFNCHLEGKTIAIWGLSFKPGTASIDNAASIKVVEALLAQNCRVQAHDPQAADNFLRMFTNNNQLTIHNDKIETLIDSDALILLTEWEEYSEIDYSELKSTLKTPVVIDGRNLFDKQQLIELGFHYYGIGR